MSNCRINSFRARPLIGALTLAFALISTLIPASALSASSPPEDRQRFVSVTRKLEQAPLNPALKADREWALAWLTDTPDVSVTICPDALGGVVGSKYRYAGEILIQDMFSMAALVIEHPETATDANAQQLAGVEGALKAYRSILVGKPKARSPALEALLQAQSRGQLADLVRKAQARCFAKK
jgi:hypothetical protein